MEVGEKNNVSPTNLAIKLLDKWLLWTITSKQITVDSWKNQQPSPPWSNGDKIPLSLYPCFRYMQAQTLSFAKISRDSSYAKFVWYF